jgi:hypothetical protein
MDQRRSGDFHASHGLPVARRPPGRHTRLAGSSRSVGRRRGGAGTVQQEAEGHLSARRGSDLLTQQEAREFRSLMREASRSVGSRSRSTRTTRSTGRPRFGFWNAGRPARERRSRWPGIVRDHVRRVLATSTRPTLRRLTPDDARRTAYARIYSASFLPSLEPYPHRDFAPGSSRCSPSTCPRRSRVPARAAAAGGLGAGPCRGRGEPAQAARRGARDAAGMAAAASPSCSGSRCTTVAGRCSCRAGRRRRPGDVGDTLLSGAEPPPGRVARGP